MVDYINSIESKLNDFIRSNLDEIFGDSNSHITIKLLSDFSISNYLKKINQYRFVYTDHVNDTIKFLFIDAIRSIIEEYVRSSLGNNICLINISYIIADYLKLEDLYSSTVRYGHDKTFLIDDQLTIEDIARVIYEVNDIVNIEVLSVTRFGTMKHWTIFYSNAAQSLYVMKEHFDAYDPICSLYPGNHQKQNEIYDRIKFPLLKTFCNVDIDAITKEEYVEFTKNFAAVVAISVSKFLMVILDECNITNKVSNSVFYIPALCYIRDLLNVDAPIGDKSAFRMTLKYYDKLDDRGSSSYEIIYTDGNIAIPFNISVHDFIHMCYSTNIDPIVAARVSEEMYNVIDVLSRVLIN